MNYIEAEEYINNIPRFTKVKSAGNVRDILEYFGNPQDTFEYIHVAGTNGKGSVCAYMDAMLRACKRHTGLFTSPHLITTTERMRVDGRDISEDEFVAIFEELMAVVKEREALGHPHPTYFEWLYIMAMVWFGRSGIEYGVIETGLGGRLDATNQIRNPRLTIITSISYDHMEILGDSLAKIASEKAGIIKDSVPVICDGTEPEACDVIKEAALAHGSDIEVVRPDQIQLISNTEDCIEYELKEPEAESLKIKLNTPAIYQTMNASIALRAMKRLMAEDDKLGGINVGVLLDAVKNMKWSGRMEELVEGVIVDGAHNVGGIARLCETLKSSYAGRKLWLVFAVANDKDYTHMAKLLGELPDLEGVIITEIMGSRRTDLNSVLKVFMDSKDASRLKLHADYDIMEAIRYGRGMCGDDGLLICTGSLYLVGSILDALR